MRNVYQNLPLIHGHNYSLGVNIFSIHTLMLAPSCYFSQAGKQRSHHDNRVPLSQTHLQEENAQCGLNLRFFPFGENAWLSRWPILPTSPSQPLPPQSKAGFQSLSNKTKRKKRRSKKQTLTSIHLPSSTPQWNELCCPSFWFYITQAQCKKLKYRKA